MNETEKTILALVYILVQDARSKGCLDDLYLGSIKLPNFQSSASKANKDE